VSYDGYCAASGNGGAVVALYGSDHTTIKEWSEDELANGCESVISEETGIQIGIKLVLDEEITAPGTYTLSIAQGAFIVSEDKLENKEASYTWEIEAPAGAFVPTTIALNENGGIVTYDAWPCFLYGETLVCDVINKASEEVVATVTFTYNAEDYNSIDAVFSQTLTAGTYVINLNGEVYSNDNENSVTETIEFTIEEATAIDTVKAAAKLNGKFFKNNTIVIVKNGVKCNIVGQTIK